MKDFQNTDDSDQETIRRALEGEHEAGREALSLCRDQLTARSLSPALADYLAARLHDVLEGIKPDRALRIAKPRGRMPDSTPDWEMHLGALAALLAHRGYAVGQIADALCDQRAAIYDLSLELSDAYRIGKTWRPMQDMDDSDLVRLIGDYKEVLKEYPPLK